MKCAIELEKTQKMIKAEAELEKITKAKAIYTMACAEAITFCEKVVAPILEGKANTPNKTIEYHERFDFETDIFGNTFFYTYRNEPIYRTVHHRNGSRSRVKDGYECVHTSNPMDYVTFKTYLEKYCFTCSKSECNYITVKPNPDCKV